MFLSLYSISRLFETKEEAIFNCGNYRYINDPLIGDINGDWLYHIKALVYHEMAHIFEVMALNDIWYGTTIQSFYKVSRHYYPKRIYHNKLWAMIYRDLMRYNQQINPEIFIENNRIFYRKNNYEI